MERRSVGTLEILLFTYLHLLALKSFQKHLEVSRSLLKAGSQSAK